MSRGRDFLAGSARLAAGAAKSGSWYDLKLIGGPGFMRRFAGRLETGKNGISDPMMGTG